MKEAVWLIAGGPMQAVLAQRIKQLGYHLILSDGSPQAFCRKVADVFLELDTFDLEGHMTAARQLVREWNIKAVLTTAADCHQTVAQTARTLGLPHLDPRISDICRDKSKTRELLSAAGLRQPLSFRAYNHSEAIEILSRFHTGVVMKASDNSGSRGFLRIEKGRTISSEEFHHTLSMGTTGYVILETCLEPDPDQVSEASVETLWVDGEMYWINWVDRIFPRDLKFFPSIQLNGIPDGIEIGHINPARHDISVKNVVADEIKKAGLALRMHEQKGSHILKADIYFSTEGPVILEMTPRTSGGWDSSGSSIERGADLPGGILHIALGKRMDLAAWMRYFHFKDAERNVVVLSRIPDNPKDCTGRQFSLVSGYGPSESLLQPALKKIEKGDYLVPVL